MNTRTLLTAVLAFFALSCVASVALADAGALEGDYTLDEEASDELMEAFEPAIEEMGRVRRGFARRAIEDEDGADEQMKIRTSEDEVRIQSGDDPVRTVPLSGETVENRDGDGDVVEQSAEVQGDGTLVVQTDSEDGETTSEYSLHDDGARLVIDMDMAFDELPKDVNFRVVYQRD